MKRSSRNLRLGLLLSVQCLLVLTQAQEDIDSNKVLNDFIWSKIISVSKNSPKSTSSKSAHPRLPLVTIPYKPSSSKSSISRRSSYTSLNPIPAASSSSYSYESGSGGGGIVSKYLVAAKSSGGAPPTYAPYSLGASASQPSSSITKPQVKSSYSGSETGKNYFAAAIQNPSQSLSGNSNDVHESSKSLYDLVPMPTYGGFSKFSGGTEQNNLYQKKRTLEIMPIIREGGKQQQYGQKMEPQIIDVSPDENEIIQIVFRSTSTPVQVKQIHTPSKPEMIEPVRTEEEPQRVQHLMTRPVIQEVHEIIQPYRKLWQEIRPVQEEIHTVVSKAVNDSANGPQGQNGQAMYSPHGNSQYGRNGVYNASTNRGNQISNGGYENKGPNYG